ncbi:class I SAM-dependent methyltransferase [Specibacter sp. AOP5-B1-6]|uniref:class I SAM-dependent methyltransferase n=1 Tax=Specibacter sp. AOP5-B1-6 TaxID=3457653 RepID=UPI00402BB559
MATVFDENFWDERYGSGGAVWSGQPNPQLVSEASWLDSTDPSVPKTALDIGCGEGADSVWLARRGWQVTAVDFSRVALQRAKDHAAAQELAGSIEWEHRDLLVWTPPASAFGLVTAQFMHLPQQDRDPLFTRLAAAVATGGSLLIVGHSASDAAAGARRPDAPGLFFTALGVAAMLEPELWKIEVAESRPRRTKGNDGESITISDEVVRAVRLG